MKTTVFELEDWERQRFEQLAQEHSVRLLSEPLTPENASQYSDAEAISTFIYSKFKEAVIKQLKNLKLIATRSTGFDHIPLDLCRERGIAVCNVPSYGKNTVAEHVFGLLLTISHKLEQAIDRARKGGTFHPRGCKDSIFTERPWEWSAQAISVARPFVSRKASAWRCWRSTSSRTKTPPSVWAFGTRPWMSCSTTITLPL